MIINVMRLLLECTKLMLVLCGILNLERKKKPIAAIVVLIIGTVAVAVKGILEPDSIISTSLIFFAMMICILLLDGKRRVLYAFLTMFGVCFVDDTILFFAKWIFKLPEESLNRNSMLYFVVSTVSVLLFAVIARILQRVYKKHESVGVAVRDMATPYLVIIVVGLSAVSLMTQVFNFPDFQWDKPTTGMIGVSIYTLCGVFFVVFFLLINSNYKKKSYKRMMELNEKYLRIVEEYYETLSKKNEEVRRFRHDIKNHMFCVETLLKEGDYKGAEEYLGGLKKSFCEMSMKYQTGNMLVNAIVNDVAGKYTGVLLDWNGLLPQKLKLPNPDVCVIFSNVLDNAFSAAAECARGKVDVSIQTAGNSLKILVENNMEKPIEEKEGRFITQKEDKGNHGFGIMNVRERVSVNGGSVEFSYTDMQFTTKIILPNVL